jgi:Flp pilus assembly protein TadG
MRFDGMRREDGQSAVELVALLPLLIVLALGAFTLLSARSAADQAAAAAQAGAMALLQDGDPKDAARAALPEPVRSRATIQLTGRRVRVTVRHRGPLARLTGTLAASSTADAGPERRP